MCRLLDLRIPSQLCCPVQLDVLGGFAVTGLSSGTMSRLEASRSTPGCTSSASAQCTAVSTLGILLGLVSAACPCCPMPPPARIFCWTSGFPQEQITDNPSCSLMPFVKINERFSPCSHLALSGFFRSVDCTRILNSTLLLLAWSASFSELHVGKASCVVVQATALAGSQAPSSGASPMMKTASPRLVSRHCTSKNSARGEDIAKRAVSPLPATLHPGAMKGGGCHSNNCCT
mmetsp:Transcript_35608/g.98631  ORF Transcript_35608/g.98631 Transcript_35608/m.98631 type:complete len:232 (-) Transcript_35608:12-707(-)